MKGLIGNIDKEFSSGEVENAVSKAVEKSFGLNKREIFEFILSSIDLTTLNSTDTKELAERLTSKVNQFHEKFPGLSNVAAICTYPTLLEVIRKNLVIPGVKIATVSGGFPSSMTFLEVKEL